MEQLFRKKSLDRISSPEELHDYLRVTSPSLWMILAAIVALLAGFIIYASTTTMENVMPVKVELETYALEEDGSGGDSFTLISITLPIEQLDTVLPGMTVRFAGEQGKITSLYTNENQVGCIVETDKEKLPLPDGEYDAELVLESTTPISFLWN